MRSRKQARPTLDKPRQQSTVSRYLGGAWQRLLRLGFRLLYNQMAWSYDLVSWLVSRGEWWAWQRAALPYLHGEVVLELAHGPGHMLLAMQSEGYRVVGLDLSPFMGRLASRRIGNTRPRISLVRGDGQSLPFGRHSFDSALSTFPTEFLVKEKTINGIYSVLKPGGRLVVVPQARLTGGGILSRLIEWLYAVTGQRPESDRGEADKLWQVVGERFTAAGFALTVEDIRLAKSQVTIMVAEKPPDSN